MTNEPQKSRFDAQVSSAFTNYDEVDDIKGARDLAKRHMDNFTEILGRFDKTDGLAYTHLQTEYDCLKIWGIDTGLYQYERNKPKRDFRNLSSVAKSSIIGSLEDMEVQMYLMDITVPNKKQSSAKRLHKFLPRPFLGLWVDGLRCIIVTLELSVDLEDESNARRGDTSPNLKTLFRRCAAGYTTVFKRINEGSSSLEDKLPTGHMKGPRNSFIRWGRETGVLLDGKSSLETKFVDSDKSESRSQIVNSLLSIESALGAMSGLLPEKRVSGKDLPAADADENSNLSLTERAKGLTEQIMVLQRCNESLAKAAKALVDYSIGSNGSNAGAVDNTATDT
ncbi:hypothetical protein J4E83_006892 [Alternaria metachromatica]|uniref:uncharacterized protein n=1 Tax=Alternaria metachromatica TaxID=283354 RepID=UPI0020C2EE4C|nr:uncharacterized protein J4E83_006892 [Alternaria metachromatica]KAI4615167.1 hypothetical protein J4E83_006892 [Alternaria metachromatica]